MERFAKGNPRPRMPEPQPVAMRIELVAADERAGNHRRAAELREPGEAGLERRAFEDRAGAVADAAFGKDADHTSALETGDCFAHGGAIDLFTIDRKSVHRVHPR